MATVRGKRRLGMSVRVASVALLLSGGAAFGQSDAAPVEPARNWLVNCANIGEKGALVCRMTQRAVQQDSGRSVFVVTLEKRAADATPSLLLTLPHGLLLPAGVQIGVDGAGRDALPFQTCDARACYAVTQVDDAFLGALRGGEKLNIGITALTGQEVELNANLIGFTAALDAFAF